jgi:hypothetical protein
MLSSARVPRILSIIVCLMLDAPTFALTGDAPPATRFVPPSTKIAQAILMMAGKSAKGQY